MSLYNFTIQQGATLQFTVHYTDSDANKIDLQHHTAKMDIKTDYQTNSGTAIAELSASNGDTYVHAGDVLYNREALSGSEFISLSGSYPFTTPTKSGSLGIYIGNTLTEAMSPGDYVYDLEITNTQTEEVVRLLSGKVKVDYGVTS